MLLETWKFILERRTVIYAVQAKCSKIPQSISGLQKNVISHTVRSFFLFLLFFWGRGRRTLPPTWAPLWYTTNWHFYPHPGCIMGKQAKRAWLWGKTPQLTLFEPEESWNGWPLGKYWLPSASPRDDNWCYCNSFHYSQSHYSKTMRNWSVATILMGYGS